MTTLPNCHGAEDAQRVSDLFRGVHLKPGVLVTLGPEGPPATVVELPRDQASSAGNLHTWCKVELHQGTQRSYPVWFLIPVETARIYWTEVDAHMLDMVKHVRGLSVEAYAAWSRRDGEGVPRRQSQPLEVERARHDLRTLEALGD